MKKYQPVIGMEIHVELKTLSKMFCGCKNDPFNADKPNIYTCPVCLGLPGALPVANKKAVEWVIMLGLALNCKINKFSKFDRKHYFYPDLPKGYQISQYDLPFCYEGRVETSEGIVRIRRIHLEEDTGKLTHSIINGRRVTLIDFNRSGVPLVEIVTEPDIRSASQAKEYAKKIYQIVRYLEISDADMEKGEMRLEANISLTSYDSYDVNENLKKLPDYKVELKNINSFKFLEKAIEVEIERQRKILEKGIIPNQETRGYNPQKNTTFLQRSKENVEDYRYFPEPDIPPIRISDQWLEKIKKMLPKSYESFLNDWEKNYKIKKNLLSVIFEKKSQAYWLDGLFKEATKQNIDVSKLINLLANKKIKTNLFFDSYEKIILLFNQFLKKDDVDEDEIEEAVLKTIKENSKAVADYKSGKKNALNFLLGQSMKNLGKKTDTSKIIKKILEKIKN